MALKMDCARKNLHAWNPNIGEFGPIGRNDLAGFDTDSGKSFGKRCRAIIAHAERAGGPGLKTTPNIFVGFFRHMQSVTWLARSRLVREKDLDYSTGRARTFQATFRRARSRKRLRRRFLKSAEPRHKELRRHG